MNRNLINLIVCIGEILIGALLLINPMGFTSAVLILLGIALIAVGAWKILTYFRSEPEAAAESGGLMAGLVIVLLGLFCAFKWEWFIITFPVLTVLYGIITLMNGINKVQWAIDLLRLKQKYWFIAMIGAVCTLLFGILILANPFESTAVLWTFIAVTLIVEAVVDILTLVFGRR